MRDFSKVSPTVWRSKKFRSLSRKSQVAFFALLAGDVAVDFVDADSMREMHLSGIISISDHGWQWVDRLGCYPAPKGRMTGIARGWIAKAVRAAVYARDGFACVYCGAVERLTLDHVHAHSLGGPDDPRNLVTACKYCNASKGNKPLSEWRSA